MTFTVIANGDTPDADVVMDNFFDNGYGADTLPRNSAGAAVDDTHSLGSAAARWATVYANGLATSAGTNILRTVVVTGTVNLDVSGLSNWTTAHGLSATDAAKICSIRGFIRHNSGTFPTGGGSTNGGVGILPNNPGVDTGANVGDYLAWVRYIDDDNILWSTDDTTGNGFEEGWSDAEYVFIIELMD